MKIIDSPLVPLRSEQTLTGRIGLRLLNEWRFILRKRIRRKVLGSLPVYAVTDKTQPAIHMLICKRDYEMSIVSAMIMNCLAKKGHLFVFHEDGSISDAIATRFTRHLPGTTLVRRAEADRIIEDKLSDYPTILEFRRKQVLALKLIDVVFWSEQARIGYMDADILFFQYPDQFIRLLRENSGPNFFNKDIADAYITHHSKIGIETGVDIAHQINSGLWVMNKMDIRFDLLEYWLKHAFFNDFLADYRLEQTFFALLSGISYSGTAYLPAGYDVSFEKKPDISVAKHYVGRIRYGYELEGLKYLITSGILR